MFRNLLRLFSGSLLIRVAGMAFGLLIAIQLARGLGPSSYGVYGLAMSMIAILTVIVEFGTARFVIREVAAATTHGNLALQVIRWAQKLVISLAFPLIISAAITYYFYSDSILLSTLFFGILIVPLVAINNIKGGALRGLHRVLVGQIPDALLRPSSFSLFLFIATFLNFSLTPQLAIAIGVASAGLALLASTYLLDRAFAPHRAGTTKTEDRRLWLKASTPMALTEVLRMGQAHGATLLLGALAAATDVGIYKVATTILVLFLFFETISNVVGAPLIATSHAEGGQIKLQRLLSMLAWGSAAASFLGAVPFVLFGSSLVTTMFGEAFDAATFPVQIFALSVVVMTLFGPAAVLLNMIGRERDVTLNALFSSGILLITGIPMMHYFGATGAALSYAISQVIARAILWRRCLKITGYDTSLLNIKTLFPGI